MGRRLTALQVAGYIANSESCEEVMIFQDYLGRHPRTKFYAGMLLNENDKRSGELLKPENELEAERFFELLKKQPCPRGYRIIKYSPLKRLFSFN